MAPQLIKSAAFTVATAFDPLLVVFSLQLPWASHTVSFISVWQFAPGALQSIVGKLGNCPLFGWLMSFHCAAVAAIKLSIVNSSSLLISPSFFFFVLCRNKNSFTLFHSRLNNSNRCGQMSNEAYSVFVIHFRFCGKERENQLFARVVGVAVYLWANKFLLGRIIFAKLFCSQWDEIISGNEVKQVSRSLKTFAAKPLTLIWLMGCQT